MAENKILKMVDEHPIATGLTLGATMFVLGCLFGKAIAKPGNVKMITSAVQTAIEGMNIEIIPTAANGISEVAALPEEAATVAEVVTDITSVAA